MITMGIDVGSTASKCLLLKDGAKILANALVEMGTGTSGPRRAMEAALAQAGLVREEVDLTLATGYGRHTVEEAGAERSELSCHARGAHFLFPGVRTVIDIGGQDVKVLRLSTGGALDQFVMNDKCAAGTGRFLEVMAHILETDVDALARLGAASTRRVDISSTCTVFAESEVISQLSRGTPRQDVAAGIHRAVADKAAGLARRAGAAAPAAMTGGVAQNREIVGEISGTLGMPLETDPLGQFAGALGAALLACQSLSK